MMVVITRGRWLPFAAICIGAVLGGWLFIANVVALSDVQLQLSGLLVASAIAVVIAAPTVSWLAWAATLPPRRPPPVAAYMLGALVPVLAMILVMRAIDPSPVAVRRAGWLRAASVSWSLERSPHQSE